MTGGASVAELYRYFLDELDHDEHEHEHDEDEHDQEEDETPRRRLTLTVTLDPLPCAGCGRTVPPAPAVAGYSAGRPLCRGCLAGLGLVDVADTITAALWARERLDATEPAPDVLHLWRLHDAAIGWAAARLCQVEP